MPTLSERLASLQGGQRQTVAAPDGAVRPLTERLAGIQGARKATNVAPDDPARLAPRFNVKALDGSAPKDVIHRAQDPAKLSTKLNAVFSMEDHSAHPIPTTPKEHMPLRLRLEQTFEKMSPVEEFSMPFAAFGEWLPDLPEFTTTPRSTEALNVVPKLESYGPQRDVSAYSNSLSGTCQGAFSLLDASGNTNNFAGDAGSLYRAASTEIFTKVSQVGGYSTGTDETWEFTRFGNTVIATNFNDDPQKFEIGTDTSFSSLTSLFTARHVAVIREFVVFGNINDSGEGEVPHRLQWSAAGDPTDYTIAAATQADVRNLEGNGGWIQSVVGGEYGVIFAERSIWRMTYARPPVVFQLDEVLPGHGTPAPNSTVAFGRHVFYLDNDGFKAVIDGSGVEDIGNNKVDKFFYSDADQEKFHQIYGTVDPLNNLYYVAYPSSNSMAGPDSLMCFDIINKKWSHSRVDVEFLYTAIAAGFTLDALDAVNSSLDALTPSLDSRVWTGSGRPLLAAFAPTHRLSFFDGATLAATIDTMEIEPTPGKRSKIRGVIPLVDGGTPTVQLGLRERQQDNVVYKPSTPADINAQGQATILENGRYIRARVNIAAGAAWEHAQGIQLIGRDDGQQ